jgi:phosphate transport system substrate-binding protein
MMKPMRIWRPKKARECAPRSIARHWLVPVLFALALSCSLTGCQGEGNITETRLKLAGSTTVEPVAVVAAEAYIAQNPNVVITVRGGGSTIGVKGAGYGALHIGMTSRPLKKAETEKWPDLMATVIGRDGVAVVVNRALYEAGVTQLTLAQIASIWQGEITNWQEVGGPDLDIMAFDKEMGRGTRDTFARIVLGGTDEPAPGTIGALGENEAVLAAVSENRGAISILSTGWQTAGVVGLAIVGQDGQAVSPSTENVANGQYPITRDLNLITDGPPEGLAAQFIEFVLSSQGQTFVKEHGYTAVSE